jgi:hypothetical protein
MPEPADFEAWQISVTSSERLDALWRVRAYRLARYLIAERLDVLVQIKRLLLTSLPRARVERIRR